VALGLNESEQALDLAEQGIAELETHPDDDLAWRLQWRKAEALRALNRMDDALASYTDAATAIDSLRKSPLGYRLDSTSLRNKLPLIEEAIAFAADTGHATDCLRFIELVKSRALASALSVPPSTRTSRTPSEIEFDDVTRELDALEYSGYSGALDGAIVRTERAALLARRVALMEQIRLRDPRWRGLSSPPPFDTARLTATLKERNQAALTLHMHDGVVRSVLVVDDGIEVGQCAVDASVMTTLADYAANLVRPTPDPYSLDPADLQLDATMFVPPDLLAKALRAGSVLIAPHGRLHLLPWSSLPFNGRRLFEQTFIGMVPNLTCALALDGVPQKAPRAALAGVRTYTGLPHIRDLPFTGVELDTLATFYGTRLIAPPLIDAAATEAAVRALAAREDATGAILHLSCHGTLSIEEPLASGVLLRDGKIDAAEWTQMRVHYDEIVLSACSTGWRPMSAQGVALDGDDILGLPGALLEAGARSIIVSIPKADDKATAAFMTAYHRHRGDSSPLAAFNQTQREMLASANEPYTWSGLVCYGVR
jgi:CHAT domain-containing protein